MEDLTLKNVLGFPPDLFKVVVNLFAAFTHVIHMLFTCFSHEQNSKLLLVDDCRGLYYPSYIEDYNNPRSHCSHAIDVGIS